MRDTRSPKKSESLEVRIPYAAKQAFMARCRREGRTASEVVRQLIEVRAPASQPARRPVRLAAMALIAAALGAAAAPSLARPLIAAEFDRLDHNGDGVIQREEYLAGPLTSPLGTRARHAD